MLEAAGLSANYGPIDALHRVDFRVDDREIVVILGANGAGKTTTLRAVSGTVSRKGSLDFEGRSIISRSADAIVRAGIAHVPQGRGTFSDLTVEDNLLVGAITRKGSVRDDLEHWLEVFPRLAERRTQRAGSLSGGEQQMLAIARALMCKPKLLLCDEPSLGLAPIITQELFKVLSDLNQQYGLAILLVEQNANLALKIAHRAYVLETGRIVASGDAQELQSDETIKSAYLGV